MHPFFSNNGDKVFFGSTRPIKKNTRVPNANIWMSAKKNGGWTYPEPLPPIINTGYENCGSFSNDNKFFFRRISPDTRGDIYQSVYANNEFEAPVKLPKEINTAYDESHPAISPDGNYIIFSSKRPGGFSKAKDELWISFKNKNDEWSRPINMGNEINNGSNQAARHSRLMGIISFL